MLSGFWGQKPALQSSHSHAGRKATVRQSHLCVANVAHTKAAKPAAAPPAPAPQQAASSNLWAYVSETTTSLASGLLAQFKFWPDVEVVEPSSPEDVAAQLRQTGKALQEASRQTKEEHARTTPPDIAKFLQPTDVKTIKTIRVMSALSAMTYKMDQLTPIALKRKLNLELVTTSKACERCIYEHSRTAEEVVEEGDGMAAARPEALVAYLDAVKSTEASNIVAIPSDLKFTALPSSTTGGGSSTSIVSTSNTKSWRSPAELVQSKIAEAAEAAAAASVAAMAPLGSAMAPLGTAAVELYKVTQELVSPKEPKEGSSEGFQYTAAKGLAMARSGSISGMDLAPLATSTCPSEWFICDDTEKEIRYFVIQGSDSIDHWRCNLTFDPVPFEDPELGVKVHRGVYDAALALYERFLPLVQEQLDQSAFSKIIFTGHSLGGSLAIVLMLMFRCRGVIPAGRSAPVYTYGAPAIFCEGQTNSCTEAGTTQSCSLCSGQGNKGGQQNGLLGKLGLQEKEVCNIIMHRDIVPRAFACDYSLVAEILKSWGPSFRDHCCLSGDSRKLMYNFIGKMMVLQPSESLTFVNKEPYHPMLPEGAELFSLVEPFLISTITAKAKREAAIKEGKPVGKEVTSLRQALLELMDTPHPLETLYDAGAYGDLGSISRYHNPDNYTKALGAIIRLKQQKMQLRMLSINHPPVALVQERKEELAAANQSS